MARRAVLTSCALAGCVAACTLVTDLEGLEGPALVGDGGPGRDATDDVNADGGGQADAAIGVDAGPSYAATVLADAPVVYLRLGDTTLPDARDERATGKARYSGASTILGRPSLVAGDPDRAVRLEGRGRIALSPVAGLFTRQEPYTVEAWIAVDATAPADYRWIVGRDELGAVRSGVSIFIDPGTGAGGAGMAMERWAPGAAQASRVTGGAPRKDGPSHVVFTFDGSNMQVWVDGAPSGTSTSTLDIPDNDFPIVIGASSGQVNDFFQGDVDEVALYDRALPGSRILAHWRAGTGQ